MPVNVSRTSVAVVISADLIAIGDQSGWSCLNSAAMPAMCGADIDVPLNRSNSRPRCPGGATAARTSTPGAPMSGFSRSPRPGGQRTARGERRHERRRLVEQDLAGDRGGLARERGSLDRRVLVALQVHGRHEVQVGVQRAARGRVDEDHPDPADALDLEALLDAGVDAPLAEDDLPGTRPTSACSAGRARAGEAGVPNVTSVARRRAGAGRRAGVHDAVDRGRAGADAVVRLRRDGRDPRARVRHRRRAAGRCCRPTRRRRRPPRSRSGTRSRHRRGSCSSCR